MLYGIILPIVMQISAAQAFNIYSKPEQHFQRDGEVGFGKTIMPYKDGILVISSHTTSRQVYHCKLQEDCIKYTIKVGQTKGLKPIISASRNNNGDQLLVCQQVRQRKSVNEELNGECVLLSDPRSVTQIINPADEVQKKYNNVNNNNNNQVEEDDGHDLALKRVRRSMDVQGFLPSSAAPIRAEMVAQFNHNNNNNNDGHEEDDDEDAGTEIAFVLDGSGSISSQDFEKAKGFISSMMEKVWQSCFTCNFAIVQYGHCIRTELSLNENDDGDKALRKMKVIKQIGNYTITASAINHVLEHVFVPENGSREGSTKIIIVLTDGEIFLDPMNLTIVLNSPKMQNVLRFAIGVGPVLNSQTAMKELQQIASKPHDKYLFMVDNYGALDGYLSQLEKSITGIEGIDHGAGFVFHLSEAGFSTHFAPDGTILYGAVGAHDWSGGLILQNPAAKTVEFLNTSSTGKGFSYLGYSVSSAQAGSAGTLYLSGAPRHNLTGAVVVYSGSTHNLEQILPGYQAGSYFGAVLCVWDVSDSHRLQYLLVGAPFFHIKGEEGKVYVYRMQQELFLKEDWEWQGLDKYSFARFGAAIGNIGDINGDKYNDVAVGAPLESDDFGESSGSIYIYNGYAGGIRQDFSQRIKPTDPSKNLRFFGQAISPMSNTHVAVGSEDTVTVLRTLPVIAFNPNMRIHSSYTPLIPGEKLRNQEIPLEVCFNTVRGGLSDPEDELIILYEVDVDSQHEEKRISLGNVFSTPDTFIMRYDEECLSKELKFRNCEDCISPVHIKLSFSLQQYSEGAPLRVLDVHRPTHITLLVPFQSKCKRDTCDIRVAFRAVLSTNKIVVGTTKYLAFQGSLINVGDACARTTLVVKYPTMLLFSKINQILGNVDCSNEVRPTTQLKCNISRPILLPDAQANFSIIWQLEEKTPEKVTEQISYNLTCQNNGTQLLSAELHTLTVKKALKVQLVGNVKPSVLNIVEDKQLTEKVTFTFELRGENKYNASITVNITFSTEHSGIQLTIKHIKPERLCESGPADLDSHRIMCQLSHCQENIEVGTLVSVTQVQDKSKVKATVLLTFSQREYEAEHVKATAPVETELLVRKLTVVKSTAATIAGSIAGLLLLALILLALVKCGFFRRRYHNPAVASAED